MSRPLSQRLDKAFERCYSISEAMKPILTVIQDTREPAALRSVVRQYLENLPIIHEIIDKALQDGSDWAISDGHERIGVQRKRIDDLVRSAKRRTLTRQLGKALQAYDEVIVLIEGSITELPGQQFYVTELDVERAWSQLRTWARHEPRIIVEHVGLGAEHVALRLAVICKYYTRKEHKSDRAR